MSMYEMQFMVYKLMVQCIVYSKLLPVYSMMYSLQQIVDQSVS